MLGLGLLLGLVFGVSSTLKSSLATALRVLPNHHCLYCCDAIPSHSRVDDHRCVFFLSNDLTNNLFVIFVFVAFASWAWLISAREIVDSQHFGNLTCSQPKETRAPRFLEVGKGRRAAKFLQQTSLKIRRSPPNAPKEHRHRRPAINKKEVRSHSLEHCNGLSELNCLCQQSVRQGNLAIHAQPASLSHLE